MRPTSLPSPGRLAVPGVVAGLWLAALLARVATPPAIAAGVAVTVVLLAPGWAVWRALAPRRPAAAHVDLPAAFVVGLAVVTAALLTTFALEGSLGMTLVLVVATSAVAAVAAGRVAAERRSPSTDGVVLLAVTACAVPLGLAVARLATIDRDAPFHLARVRMLAELDVLSVDGLTELVDGSTHPGYAIPLWHACIALAADVAGLDASVAYRHVVAAFVVLAVGLTWAAARSVLGGSGLATVAAGVAVVLGLGGLPQPGWSVLSDPPSATLQLAFPALLAVAAAYAVRPAGDTLVALTAASLAVTLLHPTYLLYAAVVLTGAVVAAALQARGVRLRPLVAGAAAVALPFVAYSVWLLPLIRDTTRRVAGSGVADADVAKWVDLNHVVELGPVLVPDPRRLAFTGLALVALVVLPLAAAWRARAAAVVLGGAGAVLVVALVPPFFDVLTELLSVSQSRRLGGFLPRPLMLAAGAAGLAVLLRDRPRVLVASALLAGLVLPWAAPSEGRPTPLPALLLVLAAAGATLVAVALSIRRRPDDAVPARTAATLAAVLLLAPSALLVAPRLVRAAADPAAARAESDPPVVVRSLPPALVRDLRALPPRSVVAANTAVAYLVPAVSTNVVYAAPPVHVANSPRNDPYGRERENRRLLAPGTSDEARSDILTSRGIDYLVLEGPERARFSGLVERGLARVLADRPPYRLLQVTVGDGS